MKATLYRWVYPIVMVILFFLVRIAAWLRDEDAPYMRDRVVAELLDQLDTQYRMQDVPFLKRLPWHAWQQRVDKALWTLWYRSCDGSPWLARFVTADCDMDWESVQLKVGQVKVDSIWEHSLEYLVITLRLGDQRLSTWKGVGYGVPTWHWPEWKAARAWVFHKVRRWIVTRRGTEFRNVSDSANTWGLYLGIADFFYSQDAIMDYEEIVILTKEWELFANDLAGRWFIRRRMDEEPEHPVGNYFI